MNNTGSFLKKYSLLIFAIFFMVISVSFTIYSLVNFRLDAVKEDTVIGNIYLGSNTPSEMSTAITYGVNEWEANALYVLSYQNQTYTDVLSWFSFDLEATLSAMTVGETNDAIFKITQNSKDAFLDELSERVPQVLLDSFDSESFFEEVLNDLKQMYYIKNYQLVDYLDDSIRLSEIDSFVISNIPALDVSAITNERSEIIIPASSRFSLLDELSSSSLSNEALSIIASGIEKVIQKSYMSGITKSQYSVVPVWAGESYNVRILRLNQLDFQFFNDLPLEYTISLEAESSTSIRFTLLGYPNSDDIEVTISQEIDLPYETSIVEDNTILDTTPGVTIEETDTTYIYSFVEQVGVDGYLKVYTRTITNGSNETISEFLMNEYTSPVTEIIRQNIVSKGE